jgi:hypothetical protein
LEPLATFYLRRAQSYAFVRTVLTEALGEDALAKMHRQTQEGPVAASLAAELDEVESLFRGAHVIASRQLGRVEEADRAADPKQADLNSSAFLAWAAAANDPDISRDARMMVPVHTDAAGKRIKVWCLLGWEPKRSWLSYAKQPLVSAADASGKDVNPSEKFEVVYGTQWLDLASPIFAEVWVTKLLNRDEFRRHCDTYVTPSVILANLQ